jgi:hypothetical protein
MVKNHSMHIKSNERTKGAIQANANTKGFRSLSEFLRWRGVDVLDLKIEMALSEIKQSVEEIRNAVVSQKSVPKYKPQLKTGYDPRIRKEHYTELQDYEPPYEELSYQR